MPASIKLQREYGEDLAVIFVESQGTKPEDVERFIMKQKWFGTPAMWTSEAPFSTSGNGLPKFALVSADGRVLTEGRGVNKEARTLIEQEIKKGQEAPEGTPRELNKAWSNFAKGKIAKAFKELEKLGAKPELAGAVEETAAEFTSRVQSRIERITWLMENGHAARAEDDLDDLLGELKGAGELYDGAAALVAQFETDEMKNELEACRAVDRALEQLYEDGRNEKLFDKVDRLAEKYSGTKAAERARRVASLKS